MAEAHVKAAQIAVDRLRLVYRTYGRRQAALQIAEGAIQDRMGLNSDLDRDELTKIALAVLDILDNAVDLGAEIEVIEVNE